MNITVTYFIEEMNIYYYVLISVLKTKKTYRKYIGTE